MYLLFSVVTYISSEDFYYSFYLLYFKEKKTTQVSILINDL